MSKVLGEAAPGVESYCKVQKAAILLAASGCETDILEVEAISLERELNQLGSELFALAAPFVRIALVDRHGGYRTQKFIGLPKTFPERAAKYTALWNEKKQAEAKAKAAREATGFLVDVLAREVQKAEIAEKAKKGSA